MQMHRKDEQPPGAHLHPFHLFDLSARKVYLHLASPLPRQAVAVSFLLHFLYPPVQETLPVRKCGALCCPDFPLLPTGSSGKTVCILTQSYVIKPFISSAYA
jgi:hypothetical protein